MLDEGPHGTALAVPGRDGSPGKPSANRVPAGTCLLCGAVSMCAQGTCFSKQPVRAMGCGSMPRGLDVAGFVCEGMRLAVSAVWLSPCPVWLCNCCTAMCADSAMCTGMGGG